MTQSDNLILETERLLIKPLSYDQLCLYSKPGNTLEKHLGLAVYPRTLSDELKEAFELVILPKVANPANNYLFSTLWTIIDKNKNVMVGDLCFKGEPNEQGEIEVGYGTHQDFQSKGYMTEALGEVSKWALSQSRVISILAETESENLSSHKTLSRNSFFIYKQVGKMIWWRLDKGVKNI